MEDITMNRLGHSVCTAIQLPIAIAATYYFKLDIGLINTLCLYPAIAIGNFLPDLDADYSYFRSKLPVIPTVYTWVQKAVKDVPVLHDIFKHRGALLHSVWTLILLVIPMLLLLSRSAITVNLKNIITINISNMIIYFLLGLVIGTAGHHFCDMLTPAGLRYFYPSRINLFGCRKQRRR